MHETRFFMDDEKNRMYILYKKMMKSYRKIISLVLQSDESLQASFLKEFCAEWKNLKQELVSYLKKMEGSWEKETKIEEDLGYFG